MAGSIFRLPEMIEYTKLSRSAIYDRMNESSPRYDSTFPKKFPLGGGAIGWFKADVNTWLTNCAEKAHGRTSNSAQLMPAKPMVVETHPKSKSSTRITQPKPEFQQPTEEFATIPASLFPQSDPTSATRHPNLGELIIEGGKQNATMLKYLNLDAWTPAMGALLVCGMQAPLNCNNIPEKCTGLDNKPLNANNSRIRKARSILEDWNEQNDPPIKTSPFDFLIWAQEGQIITDWLRLFLDLAGCTTSDTVNLTPSRFALLVARQS